jgi:DNA-binding SARP family transcriptional activator
VLPERDRLRQVALGAFGALVELRAAAGRHRDAVEVARAGLAHDRYRDSLWRQLVNSLLALDDKAAAAATQRSYRELLADLELPGG